MKKVHMSNKISCIVVDDEPVARVIIELYIEKLDNITFLKSCKSAMEAFDVINSEQVDLIFWISICQKYQVCH